MAGSSTSSRCSGARRTLSSDSDHADGKSRCDGPARASCMALAVREARNGSQHAARTTAMYRLVRQSLLLYRVLHFGDTVLRVFGVVLDVDLAGRSDDAVAV